MKKFDYGEIVALAHEAGKVARGYFGRVKAKRKSDASFVTAADKEIEELVRRRLRVLTPGFGILGEEQGMEQGTGEDAPCWVVDPLDGTGSFVSGLPCWAFSLGLVENGEAVFGIVYLPVVDEIYHTGIDGRVFKNGKPCWPKKPAILDSEAVLYIPSDSHRRYSITFPGKIRSLGSAVYHGLVTASQTTAGVLQGSVYLWDAAAILAINKAWGIKVGKLDGTPARIDLWEERNKTIKVPLLFSAPENFEKVASTIRVL